MYRMSCDTHNLWEMVACCGKSLSVNEKKNAAIQDYCLVNGYPIQQNFIRIRTIFTRIRLDITGRSCSVKAWNLPKVICEKVKFSNCDFCNNFRDHLNYSKIYFMMFTLRASSFGSGR